MLNTSTPSLSEFDPTIIPFQYKVITDIFSNFDYSKGVHEVLLSGSVGCLREDAKVMTIFGEVPIGNIKAQDYLLTHHDSSSRFALTRGSGAFPKGKGNLYRVVSAHEEFVANGNHLVATYYGNYRRIEDLFYQQSEIVLPHFHVQIHHEEHLRLFVLGVLNCFERVLNLINYCLERIHQCGLRLPLDLKNALDGIPLSNDAREYGLFFYNYKPLHMDDLMVQEPALDHIVESPFRLSMRNFFLLVENRNEAAANVCSQVDSTPFEHILADNLKLLIYHSSIAHPKEILFFLSKFCNILYHAFSLPKINISNRIYKIEKLSSNDWYWDMKVPNTNNYLAHGLIHHNSAKSLLMAHIAVVHCLTHNRARCLLARKAMPDLKDTILRKVLDHVEGDLEIKKDYYYHENTGKIIFTNGSEIICRSWADKRYRKFRSLELSCAIIEELTENSSLEFEEFYKELVARVGRIPHIKQNFVLCATNPDAPSHAAYEYFIANKDPNRHVYYSITRDNPFLPSTYIDRLEKTYTKQEARRMLYGEWLEIKTEVIYYAFEEENIIDNYKVDIRYPIIISYDFNIGMGKPMSCCFMQFKDDNFYIFNEVVISGANTLDSCEEQQGRGLWDYPTNFVIMGDASGRSKSTKYNKNDYEIILSVMKNYIGKHGALNVNLDVPLSNPPIRKRHILVNGQLKNSCNERHLFVTKNCETVIKGLRLSRLKQGGQYIEDDGPSYPYQHITTALGYAIVRVLDNNETNNNVYIGDLYGNSTAERDRFTESRFSKSDHRGNRR